MRSLSQSLRSLCALLAVGLIFSGCDAVVDESPELNGVVPSVVYDVEEGKTLDLESNVQIEFVKLLSDTRCPLEDICESDGRVDASFVLEMDGKRSPFILSGFVGPDGEGVVSFDVGPYEISLERLDPYPMEDCDMDMPPLARLSFLR